MITGIKVSGIEDTLKGISEAVKAKGRGFRSGMIAAGLYLEGACTESITNVLYSLPEAPEKKRKRTGNLRASRFTIWTDGPIPVAPKFVELPGEESPTESFDEAMIDSQKEVCEKDTPSQMRVIVGYGAHYALFVHEGVEGKFEGFKWVEMALREKQDNIVRLITTEVSQGH